MNIAIRAKWDNEAHMWVGTSVDERIGLVTEAPTLEALKARAEAVLPELVFDNLGNDDE